MDKIRMNRLSDFIKIVKPFSGNPLISYKMGFDVPSTTLLIAPQELCTDVFYGHYKTEDDELVSVGCLASFATHLQVTENASVYKVNGDRDLVAFDPNDPEIYYFKNWNMANLESPCRGALYLGLTHWEACSLFEPNVLYHEDTITPEDSVIAIRNAIEQYENHGTFDSKVWDHVQERRRVNAK